MANGKTFVRITNNQVWEQLCNLTTSNEKSHDEIKVALELNRTLLNDHLHEHQIKSKERTYRENKDRWLWGIGIAIASIVSGLIGHFA
jgi:hypothetical protein